MSAAQIRLSHICKFFSLGEVEVRALDDLSLEIDRGEFVAIMGSSGSGKSTMMNILGCLDTPTSGGYHFDGIAVETLNRRQLADLRNTKIGFVFQGFNLLPRTTALENVGLPLLYDRHRAVADPQARSIEALQRVGLGDRLDHEPNQLSGGQQQRVAIARALVTDPPIILADEPTGNLDSHTTLEVMALFQELNREGLTLVVVTHETEVAEYAGRLIELRDGMLLRDEVNPQPRDAQADLLELQTEKSDALA
ncbi:putative ABC transport system ATP-binding protein [Desulfuromusa kysingii]|uniref:Putative ABC transport system ATP-binding protein n=1 Tax=Desulfuromusa kysingii TaxID=37625 RepID=A0A1H4DXS5_9BACT|nr:ABC transporter ATP-binding protein [Desulfuromusa kysingii]SEA77583.1 putative ABC transport system ATP-binding protein [Desulfuromusa kysingii]